MFNLPQSDNPNCPQDPGFNPGGFLGRRAKPVCFGNSFVPMHLAIAS